MNILVTGAGGQLAECLKEVIETVGNGNPNHFVGEANYYIFKSRTELDITDAEAVNKLVKETRPSVIVNCAAYTNVNKAQEEQDIAMRVNDDGPNNLAKAAASTGAVLIHISTDYVFSVKNSANTPLPPYNFLSPVGDGQNVPYTSPTPEENFYGYSKLCGEKSIITSGCKYLIFRTSWLYSYYGKNFVKTIYDKIAKGEPLRIVADQIGSPTSAHDLARFLHYIIEHNTCDTPYLSKCGIYNFCNVGAASWYDLAKHIQSISNFWAYPPRYVEINPCSTQDFPQPVERPRYSVLDMSATTATFGYSQSYWVDSLTEVIDRLSHKEKSN